VAKLLAVAKKGVQGETSTNEKGDTIFNEVSNGNLEIFKKAGSWR